MNPLEFFTLNARENKMKSNDPNSPGNIMLHHFEEDTLRNFVNELYQRLNLKMCPAHFTTNGGPSLRNWKPEWLEADDTGGDDRSEQFTCSCSK